MHYNTVYETLFYLNQHLNKSISIGLSRTFLCTTLSFLKSSATQFTSNYDFSDINNHYKYANLLIYYQISNINE